MDTRSFSYGSCKPVMNKPLHLRVYNGDPNVQALKGRGLNKIRVYMMGFKGLRLRF